ncbi:MAG: HYR domain-containing protein [Bacteroidia bacterium]|nr:HYR domain-containing protein [Bacteroidia bacterium]
MLSLTALASHYRYGNISWSRANNTTRTVTLTVNQAWRRSAFGNVNVGNTVSGGTLLYGDNTSTPITLVITSVNVTEDWFYGTFTVNKTYPTTSNSFTASYSSGARIGSPLQNNANGSFASQTIINFTSSNLGSPVSTMPPIINLPTGAAAATFSIPASDPDGSTLTYSLSTPAQAGAGFVHPSGLSVNPSTGVVTFNTVGRTVGHYFSTAITITDASGSNTVVDFLILIVNPSNPPAFNYAITPANTFTYSVNPGQPVTFNVRASDSDPGSTVTLSVVGLASGMVFSPALPTTANPVNTSFSWTPTSAQLGVYVLNFTAQDNVGIQAQTSVIINVNQNPFFVTPPTPAQSSSRFFLTGTPISDIIRATNPNSAVLTRINSFSGPSGATISPLAPTAYTVTPQVTMNWTPTPANWGANTFTYTALDQNGRTATRAYTIEVNTEPSFTSVPDTEAVTCALYSYTITIADPNIPFGDVVDILSSNLPSWLTLVQNSPTTAILSGTPGPGDVGHYHIHIHAEDIYHHANPNHIEQEFELHVEPETVAPTAVCQNITASIGANGTAVITPAMVNNGSSDNCGAVTLSLNNTTFNCANIGVNNVVLTVTDVAGNSSTCTAQVTVNDPNSYCCAAPTALCRNITAYLDAGGNATVTAAQIDNGSTAGCGLQSMSISNTAFNCGNVGANTVVLTVTDINNASATCSAIVTVVDTLAPTITCPAAVSASADNGSCAATGVNLGSATTADNCGVASVTNNAPSSFPVGSTTVTWTVTDVNGNSATCTQVVTVTDNELPTITCPAAVSASADNGSCAATGVNLGSATTADNCGVASVTNNAPSSFPVGSTTVTWTVTDVNGNSATCTQVVTVTDNELPTITCPAAVSASADNGSCAATGVSLGSATTADNCGVASVTNNAPTSFPVGSTTVTWTVTDVNGNSATCTQVVTVTDNELPTITCPAAVSASADNGSCAATGVSLGSATTADNCGVASVSNNAPSSFPVGSTTVTWTVTDVNGNSATCTQVVTVTDNELPTITCPAAVSASADNGSCAATGVSLGSATTTDNCGVASVTNNAPTSFPVGSTSVTWTVTDVNGNSATCTQVVTVTDNELPTITCPAAVSASADNGSCAATGVNLGSATTADNCGVASVTNNAPTSFPVGSTTVTWTVTDVNGNSASCTQVVIVTDNELPTISCPAAVSASADNGSCAATGVSLGSATTADNCGVASVTNNAPTSFPVGSTTVTWTVTDVNGNSASCTQLVTVTDNELPTITCPAAVSASADNGSCAATGVNLGSATTTDNCGVASVTNNAPTSFPVGSTTVTWTVTDVNGNSATCTQIVTVTDNELPTITCPAAVSASADNGSCAATGVNLGSATTADNCGVASVTNNAPTSFPVGSTTVTWTVTDVNGNSATCTQVVTVTDNELPTITCPAAVSASADNGSCVATGVNLGSATTADNCGVASVTNNAPTSFPVGSTTVTWTVTDVNGNSATCTQVVTVTDNELPTITCPAAVSASADNGSCAATGVNLGSATTADNCGVASVTNNAPTSFPVGSTTVTWTVTDVNGNSATCTQVVTVTDNELPTITCPAAVSASADNGSCAATGVSLGSATTADNCGVASVTNNAPSSFPVGSTTVTWTVTDVNGNSATCTQVVTVTDNELPTITCPAAVSVSADNGSCAATGVNLGSATTGDNCGVASVTNNAPSSFPVGSTTVTWTVTDVNGNSATCIQVVTVTDNQLPTVTCPANITIPACVSTASWSVTSADNCGVASVVSVPASGSTFNYGVTPVTVTATDVNGNVSTCTFTVTRAANLVTTIAPLAVSPVATCAYGANNANIVIGYGNGPQTVTLNGSATGGTPAYTYSWYPASNLSNASAANPVFTPNLTSGCSNYTYTLTVTDANGCIATQTVTVKVVNVVAAYNNNGSVKKVRVCHITSSATNTEVDIEISPNGVPAHLAHGDCIGDCEDDCDPNARFAHVEHNDHYQGGSVEVFPNPNTGDFAVNITPAVPNVDVTVQIFDITGKLIYTRTYSDATYIHEDISLQQLTGSAAPGMYLMKVVNDEYVFTKKITVTQ